MKIILATEDSEKKEFLSQALSPLRFEIEWMEDAYAVIDAIERATQEQIVILDSPLPGMSVTQVCTQVLRTPLRWRTLLMGIPTSHSSWDALEFMKAGGDEILSWSIEGNDLRVEVQAAARLLERQGALAKRLKADSERYIPLEAIGSGGVGKVFRGIDRKLEREVAIKFLKSDLSSGISDMEAALQEARLLAKFMHTNLVTVFDYGESEEGAFLVMEIVEGESLESMLLSGPLREPLFDQLVTQSLKGIGSAHALGVLHLDLKPGNMMFGFMGDTGLEMNLKIVDFGIARARQKTEGHESLSSNTVVGSLPYIAPERFRGEPLDRRSDLYSLGHIYFEALAGRHAFQAATVQEMLDAHLNQQPPSICDIRPEISPELNQWVMRFLAKDSKERFSSALEALKVYQKIKGENKLL